MFQRLNKSKASIESLVVKQGRYSLLALLEKKKKDTVSPHCISFNLAKINWSTKRSHHSVHRLSPLLFPCKTNRFCITRLLLPYRFCRPQTKQEFLWIHCSLFTYILHTRDTGTRYGSLLPFIEIIPYYYSIIFPILHKERSHFPSLLWHNTAAQTQLFTKISILFRSIAS